MMHQWKADIICLQETKMKFVNQAIIQSLWNCCSVGWVELVSNGASGGILILWNRRVVELLDHFVGVPGGVSF